MTEFLGSPGLKQATAVYLTATNGYSDFSAPVSPQCLPDYLESDWDIERSLWDKDSLIADLDLDYENFDSAAAVYVDPGRAFGLIEPVLSATTEFLNHKGIQPLELISGRGFHLVWRIPRNSEAFRRLAALGQVPPSLAAKYAGAKSSGGEGIDREMPRAFAGLGMILEFVAHSVLRAGGPACSVPVEVTSIEVGPGKNGREIVSFDLSEYGDPLHCRHIRLPFSAYLKPRKLMWALGEEKVRRILPLFEIPLAGMKASEALEVMHSPRAVVRLSRQARTTIPDQSDGTLTLIEAYTRSDLAAFHDWFYAMDDEEARARIANREGTLPGLLPACATWILDHPNDWLLKPAALQHLARLLTALKWHPRIIAELIRNRYQADCGWGDCWVQHEASWRAIFYTRLFTGLIATGCDQLVDLNCVSHKEKGYCVIPQCSGNLAVYQAMLPARRVA
jgi:hypothetical protein